MKTITGLTREVLDVRDYLQAQINWTGPTGRHQGIVTLKRESAITLVALINNVEVFLRGQSNDRSLPAGGTPTPATEPDGTRSGAAAVKHASELPEREPVRGQFDF
ncbi:MAG TPA: hypothetical protein VJQ25_08635 [Nitrospira sp.]|nr:hypothetical protein [Nitrospira sp.]